MKKIDQIYRVIDKINQVKNILNQIRRLSGLKAEFEKYQQKSQEFIELKKKLEDEAATLDLHDQADKLEDELIELAQKLIAEKAGDVLDMFLLPDNATEEELKAILLDIPRGITAVSDMLAFHDKMNKTDIEAVKVLAIKAFAAGYLLFPLVGHLTGLINEALNNLMHKKSISDRLIGMRRGRVRKGKGKAANRAELKKVRTNKQRKKSRAKEAAKRRQSKKQRKKKDAKAKKKKKKKEKPAQKMTKKDKRWRQLVGELRDLPGDFRNGVAEGELQKTARRIKSKRKYKKVAGGVSTPSDRSRPGEHRLVVKRLDKPTVKEEVYVLKPARTRYNAIRKAIKDTFKKVDDDERKIEVIKSKVDALKAKHRYKVDIQEVKKDGAVIAWTISGKLPKKSPVEFVKIEAPGNHFGSKANPIPLDWPKPKTSDTSQYQDLYIGPRADIEIPQSELKALKGKSKAEKEVFVDDLKKRGANAAKVQKWVDDPDGSMKIRVFKPHGNAAQQKLPYGGSAKYGLVATYQIKKTGKELELERDNSNNNIKDITTEGGAAVTGPLKPFGFRPAKEEKDGDHVWERQLGGPNNRTNMWPLDKKINEGAGNLLKNMRFSKPGGSGVVTMKELKKRARKGGKQNEIWFKIRSTL